MQKNQEMFGEKTGFASKWTVIDFNHAIRNVSGLFLISIAACLPRAEEVSLDPLSLIQEIVSTPATTTVSGFSIGGTIYGDIPSGLQLDLSGTACGGAQTLLPASTGGYQFNGLPDGCSAANVAITTQPVSSFCQIYNNTGLAITGASIANVDVYCFSIDMTSGPLTVYEGTPLSVPVRLTASPGPTPVTVSFTSDNPSITPTAVLNFTQADYNTYKNITLSNPIDANTAAENATIAVSVGTINSSITANSFDTTSGSTDRFLFVTATTHNGDFTTDGTLPGANWMEKADSFCSTTAAMPAALIGTGNYRALLVDGTLRRATIGSQLNWPLSPTTSYYGYDMLSFQTVDASGVFPIPVVNLLTGGGNYWTGIGNGTTWAAGTDHCSNWTDGTLGSSGSYGIATFNNNSLLTLGAQSCDNTKSLLCAQDLRDRGDGTISSTYQNVLWQKCEAGQTWDGACSGTVTTMSFCNVADDSCNGGTPTGTLDGGGSSDAYNYCNGLKLAGRPWRVPSVAELQELYRAVRMDSSLFPGLSIVNYYMSNESITTTQQSAVLFSTGTVGSLLKPNLLRLRCVSDGQ